VIFTVLLSTFILLTCHSFITAISHHDFIIAVSKIVRSHNNKGMSWHSSFWPRAISTVMILLYSMKFSSISLLYRSVITLRHILD
jgi:hypothetical protein